MPKERKTHEECRELLCIMCFKKKGKSLQNFSQDIIPEIRKYIDIFDPSNKFFPSKICPTCRISLVKQKNGLESKLISVFNYDEYKSEINSITTRSAQNKSEELCECFLCKKAKSCDILFNLREKGRKYN